MKFSEWVQAKQNLFEAFGAEGMFNNVFGKYADKINVLSFKKFFLDHLDPKLESWKRNKIV